MSQTSYEQWLAAYERANIPTCCASDSHRGMRYAYVPAIGQLLAPDGSPAGWVCRTCADSIRGEYAAKMGELWTVRPVAEHYARCAVARELQARPRS